MNIKIVLLMCCSLTLSFGLTCNEDSCYGTLDELQQHHVFEQVTTFYVQPSHFMAPCSKDCLTLLNAGSTLDCKGNITSELIQSRPWLIPGNVILKPSCKTSQLLQRTSNPSEDVSSLNSLSLARVVILEKQTPCAVLKIQDSKVRLENFVVDNSMCLYNIPQQYHHSYVSSKINVYPNSRYISELAITNLQSSLNSIFIHMSSLSKKFPVLIASNTTMENIEGTVVTEMTCGNFTIRNVSERIVQDIPTYSCDNEEHQNKSITNLMGPLQIALFSDITKHSHAKSSCAQYQIVIVTLSLAVILLLMLSCLCYWFNHTGTCVMGTVHHLKKDQDSVY